MWSDLEWKLPIWSVPFISSDALSVANALRAVWCLMVTCNLCLQFRLERLFQHGRSSKGDYPCAALAL